MGRKSKQPGGNFPLTYHERTKKFASSEYGTVTKRLAGHSQYQMGDCALTVTKLGEVAQCTPSGYLYEKSAILEYLLQKTKDLKEQQAAYERQQRLEQQTESNEKKRAADFQESQKLVKKSKSMADETEYKAKDLKRVSYWLTAAQPEGAAPEKIPPPPERPPSPLSGAPLRRKDLWELSLQWSKNDNAKKLVCAVSGNTIQNSACVGYWTDKKTPGTIVLESVYKDLIQPTMRCPIASDKKIKYVRKLQKSGSSFSASGQAVQVHKYRPTIT